MAYLSSLSITKDFFPVQESYMASHESYINYLRALSFIIECTLPQKKGGIRCGTYATDCRLEKNHLNSILEKKEAYTERGM